MQAQRDQQTERDQQRHDHCTWRIDDRLARHCQRGAEQDPEQGAAGVSQRSGDGGLHTVERAEHGEQRRRITQQPGGPPGKSRRRGGLQHTRPGPACGQQLAGKMRSRATVGS